MAIKTKLSPPWITYVSLVKALFGEDPEIRLDYDNDNCELNVYVDNAKKASAIEAMFPCFVDFGNVDLQISIIPPNGKEHLVDFEGTPAEMFETAFNGNPAYAYTKVVEGMFSFNATYVVFKNCVVQFFADNLADVHGVISTLYQSIAETLFEDDMPPGTFFCTDTVEGVGVPTEKWL